MDRRWPSPGRRFRPLFPAHAGMDRDPVATESRPPIAVPRTRGDGPTEGPAETAADHLFPAHAGMDRASSSAAVAVGAGCSPHTRGWTAQRTMVSVMAHDCSPHTRGWTSHGAKGDLDTSTVPRTRGDGPENARSMRSQRLPVPRTRGDGPAWTSRLHLQSLPCSPHTRGWTDCVIRAGEEGIPVPRTRGDGPLTGAELTRAELLFPAHAGMDRSTDCR